MSFNVLAVDQEAVNQVSRITGVEQSRMSKIVELSDTLALAADYSRQNKYNEAVSVVDKISLENGYALDDVRRAQITLFLIHKRAGRYEEARSLAGSLVQKSWLIQEAYDEANALFTFQKTRDKKPINQFLDEYYKKNKKILPPKVHDLSMLAIIIRLRETAGEIDQSLELVEEYLSKKSLKFHQSQKTREGLNLLKEALLRDKRDGKNIYGQDLINRTDYFGFV